MASTQDRAREIGRRIAEARKEAGGMTQEELAAFLKVAPRTMQAYEQGEIIPYKHLRTLERILNKPAAWFLHGDDALQAKDEQFELILAELQLIKKALGI